MRSHSRASLTGSEKTLTLSLDAIGPGVYTVAWRVVSVDTHVTAGDFVFHVGQ
jgi:methionine-rich copper-binding protein CopC